MLTNMLKKVMSGTSVVAATIALTLALGFAFAFAFIAPAPAHAASCSSSSTGTGFAACYSAPIKSINVADNSFVLRVVKGIDHRTWRLIYGDQVVRVNGSTTFSGVSGLSGLSVGNNVTVSTTQKLTDGSVVAGSVTKN
jgi:hypothetical protein